MQNGRISYRFEDDFQLLRGAKISDNVWRKIIKDFKESYSNADGALLANVVKGFIVV